MQAGEDHEPACIRDTRPSRPGVGRDGRLQRPPEPEQPRRPARLRLPIQAKLGHAGPVIATRELKMFVNIWAICGWGRLNPS